MAIVRIFDFKMVFLSNVRNQDLHDIYFPKTDNSSAFTRKEKFKVIQVTHFCKFH